MHARQVLLGALTLACVGSLIPSDGPVRRSRVDLKGEMGFQMPSSGPLLSTSVVAASFAWLRLKTNAYNAAGDDVDALLTELRDLKVAELTSGDSESSSRVAAAEAALEAARIEMEEARTVRGPLGFTARLRLPERGQGPNGRKAKATPSGDDSSALGLGLEREAVRIAILGSVALLLLPVVFLLAADPMKPASPELAASLRALGDGAPPPEQLSPGLYR